MDLLDSSTYAGDVSVDNEVSQTRSFANTKQNSFNLHHKVRRRDYVQPLLFAISSIYFIFEGISAFLDESCIHSFGCSLCA